MTDPAAGSPRQPADSAETETERSASASAREQAATSSPEREADDGYAPGEAPKTEDEPKKKGGGLREFAIIAVIALTLSFLIKTFLAQPFYIPSESMENTLDVGDRIVVSKFTPQHSPLHRGDVIVFSQPSSWGPPPPPSSNPVVRYGKDAMTFVGILPGGSQHVVKRLIGMPGDHVACSNDKLYVNKVQLNESSYLAPGSHPCGADWAVTVPKGKVWVMGDNRDHSGDSREHDDGTGATGSVPESNITGQVVAIVWPMNHAGSLTAHNDVFAKVPNQ